jgi:hypothetical protein
MRPYLFRNHRQFADPLAQQKPGPDVAIHQLVPSFDRVIFGGSGPRRTRVVGEDVHFSQFGDYLVR